MAKDKNGNITATTGAGMSICGTCGIPYPTGTKPAHDAKSTHRAAVSYGKANADEGSAATGSVAAGDTAGAPGA